jgi:signal transduction histidine kinase
VHSSGKLIFFDKESVAEIEPAKFSLTAPKRSILLSYIKQGDKQFLVAQPKLQLPYNSNSFSINFSLQKWDAHYLVNYAYRLSDNDNWKEIGGETQLNFAALQPGSYQLQIKATDELGQWSYYSKPFEIMVNPPFWKTWWFRLLALISIIALLRYVIVRKQKQKIKQLQHQNEIMRLNAEKETGIARERERIIADLHDDVGATLSSLNIYGQLAEKVWNDKPEESRSLVNKIATTASALMGRMGDIIWSMKIVEEEKFSLESRLKIIAPSCCRPKIWKAIFK